MKAVYSRRRVLAGLGAAAVAGRAPTARAEGARSAPASPTVIHLNTASLGATHPSVRNRVLEAWDQLESSPVRMAYGREEDTVLSAAEAARERAARFLGCDADELLVTRCTTDGMNAVAQGMNWAPGDRVLTTDQEHHGGGLCWTYQTARRGVMIDTVPIAPEEHDGAVIVRRFAEAIRPATRVLSVSHVITTTGLRMPVAELSALARERGLLCVVDGAQAAGNIPVDVRALGCHAYATSGHKWLMGPKGTGLLYVRREAWPTVLPIPWQDGHRYGEESAGVGPLPLVIGLGAAIERLEAVGMAEVERHNLALRNRAYAGLAGIAGLRVVGPPPGPEATAIVACVLPDGVDSMALRVTLLDRYGILVKRVEPRWFNGIRLSPHVINTEADVDAVLVALRAELA